jgi:signal transduction histidine kinase
MRRGDGSRLWAQGSLARLQGAHGVHTGYCKILRDATQSYEQSEAVREAKEQAERANLAKDRFLAVLSHELRTPLSPIMSAAQLLERVAVVPEKYAGVLPMIKRNVLLEARLIEDLLDLTALSAGKLVLRKANVDMHRLLHAVIEMVAEQVRDKSLRLETDLCAEPALVLADEARMQQVLWNLVRNAIKFTPEGGRIQVRTRIEGGRLRLDCVDTGIGIDQVSMSRIFMAFEQADAEVSRAFGGLGLGLAIAKGLVAEHAGELAASSPGRGQGATFTLTLPLADAFQAQAGRRARETHRADSQRQRLLLVEDNADAAEALMLSLETFGYEVQCAHSCAQALQKVRQGGFDAVISDLGLPDGSGLDIGTTLRGVVPVIALSGYGSPSDMQRSFEAGFLAHLVKPADPDAVHAAVQRAVRKRS